MLSQSLPARLSSCRCRFLAHIYSSIRLDDERSNCPITEQTASCPSALRRASERKRTHSKDGRWSYYLYVKVDVIEGLRPSLEQQVLWTLQSATVALTWPLVLESDELITAASWRRVRLPVTAGWRPMWQFAEEESAAPRTE